MKKIINNNLLNLSEKKNFKEELKKIYCEKGNLELYYLFILNFFSKFEKIEWKQLVNLKLYKLNNFVFKKFVNFSYIIVSFIIGRIYDKHDYPGFKFFLNLGNLMNIIFSLIFIFIHNKTNKTFDIILSYINLFFVGNYYAIMLPELIKKYGKRYIFEVSGFIGLSNIISRIIEIYFIIDRKELKGYKLLFIMIFQICCSIISILLLRLKKISSFQFQFDLYELSESNYTNINESIININDLNLPNNDNDNEI